MSTFMSWTGQSPVLCLQVDNAFTHTRVQLCWFSSSLGLSSQQPRWTLGASQHHMSNLCLHPVFEQLTLFLFYSCHRVVNFWYSYLVPGCMMTFLTEVGNLHDLPHRKFYVNGNGFIFWQYWGNTVLQEILLRVCCSMLLCLRSRLLAGDFTTNLKLLQHFPSVDINHLLKVADDLK